MKLKKIGLNCYLANSMERIYPTESILDTDEFEMTWGSGSVKLALIKWKTMDELIKENPDYFFDKWGNFCNGNNGCLAPSFFCYLGQTVHNHYIVSEGVPKDTWCNTVVDY